MDEYVHLSLENYKAMQAQVYDLHRKRLSDAKEMLEMCMSSIYQLALKMPPTATTQNPLKRPEDEGLSWVQGFANTQAHNWNIKWEVRTKSNFIQIIEIRPT